MIPRMLSGLAAAMLMVLPVPAIGAEATECEGFEATGWAYARFGPLPLADTETAAPEPVLLPATTPLAIGPAGDRIAVCAEGLVRFADPAHLIFAVEPMRVIAGRSFSADERARLVFWDGIGQVWAYLGGGVERWSEPAMQELPRSGAAPDWPVFALSETPIRRGRRSVDVAGVLIPIPVEAIDAYKSALEGPSGRAEAVFVVDLSARAEGYVAPLMRAFADLLEADKDFRGVRIAVVALGRGQAPKLLEVAATPDLRGFGWNHYPPADGARKSLAGAIELALDARAGDAPIFVLAAGDVEGDERLPRADLHFVQITPELDEGLLQQAGPRFEAFAPGLHGPLYDLFSRTVERRPERTLSAEDLGPYRRVMAEAGVTAIGPANIGEIDRFGASMSMPEGTVWFARPLWVVVDNEVIVLTAP